MQLMRQIVVALAIALAMNTAASSARALIPNQVSTTITQVIVFQNGMPQVLIRTASNDWCYFDSEANNGKALLSIVLGARVSRNGDDCSNADRLLAPSLGSALTP